MINRKCVSQELSLICQNFIKKKKSSSLKYWNECEKNIASRKVMEGDVHLPYHPLPPNQLQYKASLNQS